LKKIIYNLIIITILIPITKAELKLPLGAKITMSGYKVFGIDKNGKKKWSMYGEKFTQKGKNIQLEKVTIIFYQEDGTKVVIKSPKCTFDAIKKTGRSNSNIKVTSKDMIITGVGYDFNLENRSIFIHNKVVGTITTAKQKIKKSTKTTKLKK